MQFRAWGKGVAGLVEAICLAGVWVFIIATVALVLYATHVLFRRMREEFKNWANSQAQRDEKSGEFTMQPARRLALIIGLLTIISFASIGCQLAIRPSGSDTAETFSLALIILVPSLGLLFAYAVGRMRLRYAFRFDKNGIREYRDSAMVKSVEWRNVETVTAPALRFSIIIAWNDGVMVVPTSHIGLMDLLETIVSNVPESRQVGIKKMIERMTEAQSKLAPLGFMR